MLCNPNNLAFSLNLKMEEKFIITDEPFKTLELKYKTPHHASLDASRGGGLFSFSASLCVSLRSCMSYLNTEKHRERTQIERKKGSINFASPFGDRDITVEE